MKTLGSFSKGIEGSVAINFSRSGAHDLSNCDPICKWCGNGCYAEANEARKPTLRVNLEAKKASTSLYLEKLLQSGSTVFSAPWVRFSAFGSVPMPESVSPYQESLLKQLANVVHPATTHFPVETLEKGRYYRELGFQSRISCGDQSDIGNIIKARDEGFNVSIVATEDRTKPGWTKRSKARARRIMRNLLKIGIHTKVCPAIVGSTKCGNCTMCADTNIDCVIYPEHP